MGRRVCRRGAGRRRLSDRARVLARRTAGGARESRGRRSPPERGRRRPARRRTVRVRGARRRAGGRAAGRGRRGHLCARRRSRHDGDHARAARCAVAHAAADVHARVQRGARIGTAARDAGRPRLLSRRGRLRPALDVLLRRSPRAELCVDGRLLLRLGGDAAVDPPRGADLSRRGRAAGRAPAVVAVAVRALRTDLVELDLRRAAAARARLSRRLHRQRRVHRDAARPC